MSVSRHLASPILFCGGEEGRLTMMGKWGVSRQKHAGACERRARASAKRRVERVQKKKNAKRRRPPVSPTRAPMPPPPSLATLLGRGPHPTSHQPPRRIAFVPAEDEDVAPSFPVGVTLGPVRVFWGREWWGAAHDAERKSPHAVGRLSRSSPSPPPPPFPHFRPHQPCRRLFALLRGSGPARRAPAPARRPRALTTGRPPARRPGLASRAARAAAARRPPPRRPPQVAPCVSCSPRTVCA